jgi:hypothetical protein
MGQTEARAANETARLRLARYRVEGQQAKKRGAAHAAQVSAEALAVEHVGVWMFRGRNQLLVCLSQFTRSTRTLTSDHATMAAGVGCRGCVWAWSRRSTPARHFRS